MNGADLKEWRERNEYTQQKLGIALGVSRQTVVAWEQAQGPLAKLIELALRALEKHPVEVAGKRSSSSEYRFMRNRQDEPGSRVRRDVKNS